MWHLLGRGLQKQMLLQERKNPIGSVSGLCGLVPACRGFYMSTVTKHKLVAFIREIRITSELGKCTAVRWRENTEFKIKLCCLCQCTVSGVVRGCLYQLLGCLCSKSSCVHEKVNWVRGADSKSSLPQRLLSYPNVQLPSSRKAR